MTQSPKIAGGRAAEAGLAFQAGVGAWFAANVAAETPVGGRFGLAPDSLPVALRFETGTALDDVEVELADGSVISLQCKTNPDLGARKDSDFAKTVAQLVGAWTAALDAGRPLGPGRFAAVLAVPAGAARNLDDLEAVCRAFDLSDDYETTRGTLNQDRLAVADRFIAHVRRAWPARATEPGPSELTSLFRLFHLARFDVEPGGADYEAGARLLGGRLYGDAGRGAAPMRSLLALTRRLVRSGAPADRQGLMRGLRRDGHEDVSAPRSADDIRRLETLTGDELKRLRRHGLLTAGIEETVDRECFAPLRDAAGAGSMLVVGEPGAGKTGVLVRLAESFRTAGTPLVFLSVDRLSGVTGREPLRRELGLDRDLVDVLEAWPGTTPAVLIVDALDATRGGLSEAVFAMLIEDALRRLGERWSVVASIRTFDLRNGRRFREAFAGSPPEPTYAEKGLDEVRHFTVPALTPGEVADFGRAYPPLGTLLDGAPPSLESLLRNAFNVSLAADLLKQNVDPEDIRSVSTQSDLIDEYEKVRLPTLPLERAVRSTVATMVAQRSLTVQAVLVDNDLVEDVLHAGVLTRAGDKISFAHHVLFDHAAGRFYLNWGNPSDMVAQIGDDPAVGLMLAPSLRFAMERIWRESGPDRSTAWHLVADLSARENLDPVILSVALRTATESVRGKADVARLAQLLVSGDDARLPPSLYSRLSRFVLMQGVADPAAEAAWAGLAEAGARRGGKFLDGARILLQAMPERELAAADPAAVSYGRAARALLASAWGLDYDARVLITNAIRFVVRSYGSDPTASRALLEQIVSEPRFTQYADQELPWLAEGVEHIYPHDPAFAERIYEVAFGRAAPQEGTSWMGGQPSQILPLSSNRRQDYEHARWQLRQALPAYLKAAPVSALRAVNMAVIGEDAERSSRDRKAPSVVATPLGPVSVVDDYFTLEDWRRARRHGGDDDVLSALAAHLRECSDAEYKALVEEAVRIPTAASVWARLLGVAAERRTGAEDLLWAVAGEPAIVRHLSVLRDAIEFLARGYGAREVADRAAFERGLLARDEEDVERLLARWLCVVDPDLLVTPEMHRRRQDLDESDGLRTNAPLVSFEVTSGPVEGSMTDHLLRRGGRDPDSGPDGPVRAAGRRLEEMLGDKDAGVGVGALWQAVQDALAVLEPARDGVSEEVGHSTWGFVGNAVERIAADEDYRPKTDGHPPLERLVDLIGRLLESPYPVPGADGNRDMMSWSNWDVRVYAASTAVALAPRFAAARPRLIELMARALRDPVATVRLQVAQSLNVLWDVARDDMWALAETVASDEPSDGVLAFFIRGPVQAILGGDPDRCESLVARVIERKESARDVGQRRRGSLEEGIGNQAAHLDVGLGREAARGWVDRWLQDVVEGDDYLWSYVSALRSAFFIGVSRPADPGEQPIGARARARFMACIAAASRDLERVREFGRAAASLSQEERAAAERLHIAAERLLDHLCNQLYFGSGASSAGRGRDEDTPGLLDEEAKRRFLDAYSGALQLVGRWGSVRTIHHLVELYGFVAPADPARVFGEIAATLTGAGAQGGYQFEGLAADALVRLVRTYLADHRSAFQDETRRKELVSVLELFSQAGWPEALRLLYDLPDLLR